MQPKWWRYSYENSILSAGNYVRTIAKNVNPHLLVPHVLLTIW